MTFPSGKFRIIAAFAMLLVLLGAVYFFGIREGSVTGGSAPTEVAKKATYTCPMHPGVIAHEPGDCPICHMALQKVEVDDGHAEDSKSARTENGGKGKILFYRNPMDPSVTSPTPAKDHMGMDYIPVYESDVEESSDSGVNGRSGFSLNRERQQLIGVTSAKAEIRPLELDIRASGKVAFDPELFTAVEEYRQALLSHGEMKDSEYASLRRQSAAMVKSAKTKLRLMGLTNAQINQLARGESSAMDLLLPEGKVWVYAEVFEYEAAGVKTGQKVEVQAPSIPGQKFEGKVSSVSPVLNSATRTLRVLAQVPDPKGVLRPDTFVNVRIINSLGERLTVPADAVLHSGNQDFVFLMQEKGRFEPQAVTLGHKAQDYYEVISGLEEGQTVVTAANFLIDSESRLRSTLKNMTSDKPSSSTVGERE